MHKFFSFIILSDYKMSMSSLSGSLDMFIISWCLIKRSLPIWKAKIIIHLPSGEVAEEKNKWTIKNQSKISKKSSIFRPWVIKLPVTKSKIYGTFIEIHHSMTLKNGEDFSCRSKGRLDCGQTREKMHPKTNWKFLFWLQLVFA